MHTIAYTPMLLGKNHTTKLPDVTLSSRCDHRPQMGTQAAPQSPPCFIFWWDHFLSSLYSDFPPPSLPSHSQQMTLPQTSLKEHMPTDSKSCPRLVPVLWACYACLHLCCLPPDTRGHISSLLRGLFCHLCSASRSLSPSQGPESLC